MSLKLIDKQYSLAFVMPKIHVSTFVIKLRDISICNNLFLFTFLTVGEHLYNIGEINIDFLYLF